MRFALSLGDDHAQQLPIAAAANEIMKKARYCGHDESDFSAVIFHTLFYLSLSLSTLSTHIFASLVHVTTTNLT
jgi:hypothetical protein